MALTAQYSEDHQRTRSGASALLSSGRMSKDDSRSAAEIAQVWIAYHLWSATQPTRCERLSPQELRDRDAEASLHGFWAWEAVEALVRERPEDGWSIITRLVELSPDDRILANVAAGPLENLLNLHAYEFIDRIEEKTRDDAKFRRCVSGVWGWSSIPEDVQLRLRRTWDGEDPL